MHGLGSGEEKSFDHDDLAVVLVDLLDADRRGPRGCGGLVVVAAGTDQEHEGAQDDS
jgi:hypothetical protein